MPRTAGTSGLITRVTISRSRPHCVSYRDRDLLLGVQPAAGNINICLHLGHRYLFDACVTVSHREHHGVELEARFVASAKWGLITSMRSLATHRRFSKPVLPCNLIGQPSKHRARTRSYGNLSPREHTVFPRVRKPISVLTHALHQQYQCGVGTCTLAQLAPYPQTTCRAPASTRSTALAQTLSRVCHRQPYAQRYPPVRQA